jgi:cytochrome c-type biogenesis protein CcmE
VELTPRTATEPPGPQPTRRRSPVIYVVLAVVLIGLGVVVYQALTSASLYFLNADEAIAQRADLGEKRFRLQGTVVGDPEERADGEVDFTVAYNGESVAVVHHGDPPELFDAGIPVVIEGHWNEDGAYFASDRIIVKHTPDYKAEHDDRLKEADENGTGSTSSSTP